MGRLISWLMIFTLVIGNGSFAAAAICQHRSAADHIVARQSHDPGIAAQALTEETAAEVKSKKGSASTAPSLSLPAMMMPSDAFEFQAPIAEVLGQPIAQDTAPPGTSPAPLLRPPLA